MNVSSTVVRNSLRGAAIVAAAAGLLGAVPAQSGGQQDAFSRPLGGAGARSSNAASAGSTTLVMTSQEDGQTYSVKVHNNEVSAEVDGKPVPPDRIDRKGDVIIIKDADGNTIKKFDIAVQPMTPSAWTQDGPGGRTLVLTPSAPGTTYNWAPQAAQPSEPPPPVMIGITMSDPTGSLAEHLGLKEGEAFVIDRVVDDLPAAKAGLEPYDVVTAIDGEKPATQAKLREVLRDKKAGDTLELTVIRKGKERKVTIELAAYDRSKLSTPGSGNLQVMPAPAEGSARSDWLRAWGGNSSEELRKQLEEAMKSLQGSDQGAAEDALKKAMGMLDQARTRQTERYKALTDALGERNSILLGDDRGQFFAMPGDREVNRRLERLSDQLEKLNHRLDDIEKRLNEK